MLNVLHVMIKYFFANKTYALLFVLSQRKVSKARVRTSRYKGSKVAMIGGVIKQQTACQYLDLTLTYLA
jgi:hypothetical protein